MSRLLNIYMLGYMAENNLWKGELCSVLYGRDENARAEIKCVPTINFEFNELELLVLSVQNGEIKTQRDRNKLNYLYEQIAGSWGVLFQNKHIWYKTNTPVRRMFSEKLVLLRETNEMYLGNGTAKFCPEEYQLTRNNGTYNSIARAFTQEDRMVLAKQTAQRKAGRKSILPEENTPPGIFPGRNLSVRR